MPEPDNAVLAAQVLDGIGGTQKSLARYALATLVERLEAAEAENRLLAEEIRIRETSQIPMIPRGAQDRLDAAEAEATKLKDKLAALRTAHKLTEDAEVARLREALQQVLGFAENNDEQRINDRLDAIHRIARAALAHTEEA